MHWLIYLMGGVACITALIGSASFHYGMCFYVIDMVADLKGEVANFDDFLQAPSHFLSEKTKLLLRQAFKSQRMSKITRKFIREIEFHKEIIKYGSILSHIVDAKRSTKLIQIFPNKCSPCRITSMMQEVMSAIIFNQILMCAVIIALNLFNLMSNGIAFNFRLVVSSYELICSVVPTYIYCYLSNVVRESMLEVGDSFYQYAWYDLTLKQQKMVWMVIRRTHSEFSFNGLGLVYCSLDAFLSVIYFGLASWSYRWTCVTMVYFGVIFQHFR